MFDMLSYEHIQGEVVMKKRFDVCVYMVYVAALSACSIQGISLNSI